MYSLRRRLQNASAFIDSKQSYLISHEMATVFLVVVPIPAKEFPHDLVEKNERTVIIITVFAKEDQAV
jgi:hypothetical protein